MDVSAYQSLNSKEILIDYVSVSGPGSFIEVHKILPLLTEASPNHPSFHVVALSLPGYGFSQAPTKKGFKAMHYAEVCHLLLRYSNTA